MLKKSFSLLTRSSRQFCSRVPQKAVTRESLKAHNWLQWDESHKKSEKSHRSNAEQNIHNIPVIMVDTDVVRCIGGTQINAGHPQVYIQTNLTNGKPAVCKWCGLKYARKAH